MYLSPYATKLTREIFEGKPSPARNMWNGKPFRTRLQKIEAKRTAERKKDGTWRTNAPVSWHPVPRGQVA